MAKIRIGAVSPTCTKPKPVDKKVVLFAAKAAGIYPEQITNIDLGCTINIPEGYIGFVTPYKPLIDISSVLIEGNGIVSGAFSTIQVRKGTAGGAKVKQGDPIATLILVPVEPIEFSYY